MIRSKEKIELEKKEADVTKKKTKEEAVNLVTFEFAGHKYTTTKDGRDLIITALYPDEMTLRLEKPEAHEELENEDFVSYSAF